MEDQFNVFETDETGKTLGLDLVSGAIAKLRAEIADRSFSGRHPELGKMVKCQICHLRHRSSIVCKERVLIPTAQTRKGVYGAAQFQKKRLKPHHSHQLLQLVQLTQELFPSFYPDRIQDPQKAMYAARGQAMKQIDRKNRARRAVKKQIEHQSRQINRGLIYG